MNDSYHPVTASTVKCAKHDIKVKRNGRELTQGEADLNQNLRSLTIQDTNQSPSPAPPNASPDHDENLAPVRPVLCVFYN